MSMASAAVTRNHPRVRTNNFDLLRLLLAATVFFYHSYALSGNSALSALGKIFNATLAVQSFFVISGFLIFMSYENCRSVGDYLEKRTRRIYPAYFTIVILCAIGGVFISSLPPKIYAGISLWKYLAANLVFQNYLARSLPGVFQTNLYPDVNGALWTIKVEVMFYLSVPVIVTIMRRFGNLATLTSVYVLSLIYLLYCNSRGALEMGKQMPGQMCFFVGGALLFYYFHQFEQFARRALWAALAGAAVESVLHTNVLYPLCLAVIVIYAACFLPGLTRFRPKWDLSYGVYIFHFPVLQLFVSFGWFASNPLLAMALAAIVVTCLACLSWNFIEKRFLSSRRRHGSTYAESAAKAY